MKPPRTTLFGIMCIAILVVVLANLRMDDIRKRWLPLQQKQQRHQQQRREEQLEGSTKMTTVALSRDTSTETFPTQTTTPVLKDDRHSPDASCPLPPLRANPLLLKGIPDPTFVPSFHARYYWKFFFIEWRPEHERRPVDQHVPRDTVLKVFKDFGCFTNHFVTAATGFKSTADQSMTTAHPPQPLPLSVNESKWQNTTVPVAALRSYASTATTASTASLSIDLPALTSSVAPSPQQCPVPVRGLGLRNDSVVICSFRTAHINYLFREGICVDTIKGAPIDLSASVLSPYSRQSAAWSFHEVSSMLPNMIDRLQQVKLRLDAASVRYPEVEDMSSGKLEDIEPTIIVNGSRVTIGSEASRREVLKEKVWAEHVVYTLAPDEEAFWCINAFADMPAQIITQVTNCLSHYYGSGLLERNVTLVLPRCPRKNSGLNPDKCLRMLNTFVADVVKYIPGRVLFLEPDDILIGRVHFFPMMFWEGAPPCSLFFQREFLVPAVRQRFRANQYQFQGSTTMPYKVAMLKTRAGGYSDRQFILDDKAKALLARANFTIISDTLPYDERIFLINEAQFVMVNSGGTHSALTRMYGPRTDPAQFLKLILLFHKGYDDEWYKYLLEPVRHCARGGNQDGVEIGISNGTTWNYDGVWEKAIRLNSDRLDRVTEALLRFPPCERFIEGSLPPAGCRAVEEQPILPLRQR